MTWLWYLLIFFLGASLGSFLNVLIGRTIKGEDWVGGRSRCDHCGRTLRWFDMIPLLSFLLYRGQSRCCKKKLSYQHLLVEGLTGLLVVWWVLLSSAVFQLVTEPGRSVQPLFWLVTGGLLLTIAVTDLYYGVIPLPFVGVGVGLTVVYRVVLALGGSYQWVDLGRAGLSGLGLAWFYLFLRWVTRGRGMGEGDAWLGMYLGMLLSWPRVWQATMTAFVAGAGVGVLLIALRIKTRKDTIPFGPWMVLGAVAALLWRW